jgi:hypothetical protein
MNALEILKQDHLKVKQLFEEATHASNRAQRPVRQERYRIGDPRAYRRDGLLPCTRATRGATRDGR